MKKRGFPSADGESRRLCGRRPENGCQLTAVFFRLAPGLVLFTELADEASGVTR